MKVNITEIDGNEISFVQDGVKELQKFPLASWVKSDYVSVGEAEITVKEGEVSFCTMSKDAPKTAKPEPVGPAKKSGKDNLIVNIKGKDFMTYEGLLKKAHEKGKFNMIITESWVSENMKMAWCKVRLTAQNQDKKEVGDWVFDGFGSSTPDNTGTMTEHHPVEMAHTRAKGRALRDYLNIGKVMAEEIKQ